MVFFVRFYDFIVHKELVEFFQLFLGVEWDLDNLVNEEENKGEGEDDVGVEGEKFTDCIMSVSIFAVVGAVPYHPPGREFWVLSPVSCRIVHISVVISTKVLLIIIKYINIGVFLAPKEAQEILNVKLQLLITFFYLAVIAEHWCA